MRRRNKCFRRFAGGILILLVCLTFSLVLPGSISNAEEVSPSQKALIEKYFQTVDSSGNVIQDDIPFVNDGKNSEKTDTTNSSADNEQSTGSEENSSGDSEESSGSEETPEANSSGKSEQAKTSDTGGKTKKSGRESKSKKSEKDKTGSKEDSSDGESDSSKSKRTNSDKTSKKKETSGKAGIHRKGSKGKSRNKLVLVDPAVLKLIGGVLAVLFVLIVINFSAIFVLMKKKKINGGKENAETQQ